MLSVFRGIVLNGRLPLSIPIVNYSPVAMECELDICGLGFFLLSDFLSVNHKHNFK